MNIDCGQPTIKRASVCLFLLFLFVLSGCRVGQEVITPMSTPMLPNSRAVSSSTLDLVEVWRVRTGVPNPNPDLQNPPFLFSSNGKLIISTFLYGTQVDDALLTAYSQDGGTIVWQTRFANPDFGTGIQSAYLDNSADRLYLVYSFRVGSFDLETGEQLWLTSSLGTHTGYFFTQRQNGGGLSLDSTANEHITIDPVTGQVLSRQYTGLPVIRIALQENMIAYFNVDDIERYNLNVSDTSVFAAVNEDSQVIWQLPYYPVIWPTFVNENDFLVEFGGPLCWIWKIDSQTGSDYWRSSPDIVSNYTVFGDKVYALRQDGYLLSMDLESGELLGYMTFDYGFSDFVGQRPFWLIASAPYLFIYFGDSQELIAFR